MACLCQKAFKMSGILIIGAGHAGGTAAGVLRQYGYEGAITLIGSESYLPYQRPPLSKAWLKEDMSADDLLLRPDSFYSEHNIDLRLGQTLKAIDRKAKRVKLADGQELSYEYLILATGSKPRPCLVDGAHQVPHHLLRSIEEAKDLKLALTQGGHIGLIGAGYVGLEVAASAIALGCRVTVFEREARVLARVASPELAGFLAHAHAKNGVEIITNAHILSLSLEGDIRKVHLSEARTHGFDHLLIGIGALPADDLARDCGLECENGIRVDAHAQTSDAYIFAIGDVTSREISPYYQGRYRLESVPNALEQAKQAAAAITGHTPPTPEVPWFWSDQYGYKLQIAGLNIGTVRRVIRSEAEALSVFHLDADNRLVCAECINRPADFMAGKLLIAKGTVLDPARLSDLNFPLKTLLKA
jgi:3-phenylpropionate/trans-cinnamate dioxygenase ferredoxin reductase component